MRNLTLRTHRRGRDSRFGRIGRSRAAGRALAALFALALAACAQQGSVDRPEAGGQEARDIISEREAADLRAAAEAEAEAARRHATAQRTVALLLPLSGQHARLGEGVLQAAELALFDLAAPEFDLVVRDTMGTPEGAEAAAREAVEAGAGMILGPVFSGSVEAVTPVVAEAGIPVLSFSNNRAVARPDVYVMGWLPTEQVERVAGYASSQGLQRFAALAPDNAYGDIVVTALQDALARFGGELVDVAFFAPEARDVSPQVKRLSEFEKRQRELEKRKVELRELEDDPAAEAELERLETLDALGAAPFDAILLPIGGNSLRTIAPTLPFYDIDPKEVQFLGTAQWNDPTLGTEPALVGGWFAAPSPAGWNSFQARYERSFGEPPPRLASLAYDATALAAVLARNAAASPNGEQVAGAAFDVRVLTRPSGYSGVDGVFRLTAEGLVERRYAVLEMQRNRLKVLDPAPTSFRELTN